MPNGKPSPKPAMIGRLRLASQGLLANQGLLGNQRLLGNQGAPGRTDGGNFSSIPEAVRWMTAMQAQDLGHALWAVGQRVPGSGASDVRAALDAGTVVRSWPMRGTLHLVAPEDLRWMLEITSPRLMQSLRARHRELNITADDISHARDVALKTIADLASSTGAQGASREQLFAAFEDAGQITKAQRGIHLIACLCQETSLVQGPMAGSKGKIGVQQLFVPFDQWIRNPRTLEPGAGIAEWFLRYIRSHGPATVRDFAWWTQVPLSEARAALNTVKELLVELPVGDTSYWMSPETAAMLDDGVPGSRSVLALPGFDEFLLGYQDRSLVLAPEYAELVVPGKNGVFKRIIVAGGGVVGTWARAGTGKSAGVVPEPFAGTLAPAVERSFQAQARAYLKFMES